MTKEERSNIKKYINKYERLKFQNNTNVYINIDNGICFIIEENKEESFVSFYFNKSTFSFIIAYNKYIKNKIEIPENVKNKSEYLFKKFIDSIDNIDEFAVSFRNIKLLNPFRNYISKGKNEFYDYFNNNRNKIYIHYGFISLFNSISDVFYDKINELKNKTKKITFLGLSFAAPIAELAYLSYILANPNNYENTNVYLYGSPKLGNQKYVNSVSKIKNKIHRINLSTDIIPKIPIEKLGYADFCNITRIKIENESKYLYSTASYTTIINRELK